MAGGAAGRMCGCGWSASRVLCARCLQKPELGCWCVHAVVVCGVGVLDRAGVGTEYSISLMAGVLKVSFDPMTVSLRGRWCSVFLIL